jgi:hypothetical protein
VTGSNGCSKNSNVIAVNVPCRTGVEEQEIALWDGISLFPNPSNGTFNLKIAEIPENGVEVIIYDILGKQVDSFIAADHLTLFSNPELLPGIYLLTVKQGEAFKNIKFVISE